MTTNNNQQQLEWGETPWDNLTREELLREVQRMYAALTGLYSVTKMSRATDQFRAALDPESDEPPSPYWSKAGVGGNELEKARQILDPLEEKYGASTYRAFFRYAVDLLFEKNGFEMIGSDWVICPECGQMIGARARDLVGQPCTKEGMGKKGCVGTLRKLEWGDLKVTPKEEIP